MSVLLLVVLTLGLSLASPARAQDATRGHLSTMGLPGVISIPSAQRGMPTGRVAIGYNTLPDIEAFWQRANFTRGIQHNLYVGMELLPRLDVSMRYSYRDPEEEDGGPLRLFVGPGGGVNRRGSLAIDRSPNVIFRALDQSRFLPAVAVGLYDISGTERLRAPFVVATRTLGSAAVTVGYGDGDNVLPGAFGGVTWDPTPFLGLRGEWNGNRMQAGVGLRAPLPEALGMGDTGVEVNVYWAEDEGVFVGGQLGLPLSPRVVDEATGDRAPAQAVLPWTGEAELRSRLEAAGIFVYGLELSDESVRLAYEGPGPNVASEETLDAVLRILAAGPEASPRSARLLAYWQGRPSVEVQVAAEGMAAAARGGAVGPTHLSVDYARPGAGEALFSGAAAEGASAGGTDPVHRADPGPGDARWALVLSPTLHTHLGWEAGVADARFGLVPALQFRLGGGFVAGAGVNIPFWQSDGLQVKWGPLRDPFVDFALLAYQWQRRLGAGSLLATEVSAGRHNEFATGVRQQAALSVLDGHLRLDADVGYYRHETFWSERREDLVALGGARVLVPTLEARLSAMYGQFADGDRGTVATLERYFGDTAIYVQFRHTDHGSQGWFGLRLPLSGTGLGPSPRVRLRGPAEWEYGYGVRALWEDAGGGFVTHDIGRRIDTRFEGWTLLLDRDRLHPAAVRAGLQGG